MNPDNGNAIITMEAALQILDRIDAYRRKRIDEREVLFDYDMRVVAAFVAQAAGFDGRTDWTDRLKAIPETKYAQDLAEMGAFFRG